MTQVTKGIWAAAAFIALLTTLGFGMAQVPDPKYYVYVTFSGLIAAGATGALIRSSWFGDLKTTPFLSLIFGMVAGLAVGLAYLIPQYVGAPGVLRPSATVVDTPDKIQFVSAILVAISAGIGFDTVFNNMKKKADDLGVGP